MQTLKFILNLRSAILVLATFAALSDVPAPAQQAFYPGFLKREVYLELGGEKIDNLIDAPKFPNAPDLVTFESSFESAPLGFTYGQRFTGFIVPKETARYLFYVAADNTAELFLSADESSTNKVKIAYEPEWALPREWTGNSDGRRRGCDANPPACENISQAVLLEVNKRYYVELLHKEGFGSSAGNHVGVTWRKEADPEPLNDSEPIGAEFLGTLADANVTVSQQPADVTVAIGERASFSVVANVVPGGITYQWFNGANAIAGATAAAYTTDPLALSDSGTKYHVVVSSSGSGTATSREAIVTVGAQIFSTGFLKREVYNEIFGGTVADLRAESKFPDFPDASEVLTLFEAPSDVGNNYGQRISGFITPSETANYSFFIASDEGGELWLSTDDTRANLQFIASEPEWNAPRDWVGTVRRNPDAPENRSLPITLTAGRRYYVEALQKEDNGADNLGVTAIKEGDALPVSGSAPLGGAFIAGFTAPTSATVVFTNAPQNVTTTELATVTFSLGASSIAGPISYQWQKNGTNVLRVNGSSYTTPPLTLADNGAQFRCIAYIPGNVSATSAVAQVTLDTDVSPPAIKVASALGDPVASEATQVVVVFDEPVDQASAETASNFTLDKGATVSGSTLDANLKTVVLTTSTLTSGVDYTLTVNGVKDRSARINSVTNATRVFRVTHLAAYYTFDDAANLGADLVGGYDGKASNGASFTNASLFGAGALNVDGVDDRLVVAKTPVLEFTSDRSVSISLWINIPRVRDSWQGVFTSSGGARGVWLSQKNSFTDFRNRYDLHGWVGTDLLGFDTTNGWHHLALVLDGNNLTRNLYVDGTLAVTGEGGDTTDDGPWWFGGVEGLTAEFFKGTIDEVRIYNVRLSDAEISALATLPVQAPPLKIILSANGIVLSWPAAATGFNLETTVQLSPASWLPVANPPIITGNDFTLTLPVESGTRFYRLKK